MVNRDNYHLTKDYLKYLDGVLQLGRASVGRYRFYLRHLLIWADEAPLYKITHIHPTFSSYLASVHLDDVTAPLAPATLKKIIQTTKRFLAWAKEQHPREFRTLPAGWLGALRPPKSVPPAGEHVLVTLAEIRQLAALHIPDNDLALRRDQAAAILLYLSGMRAGALGTLSIQCVDVANRTIKQWPALGVHTKNSKSATTYLLDIPDLLVVVERWDSFVRAHLPLSAMWYTPVTIHWGEQQLSTNLPGSNRNVAIIKRIKKLYEAAGLPYKSPHKFRHGHAVYALQHAHAMADYKAVSMNLMHADIRVTDGIYAPLLGDEVKQRIAGLTGSTVTPPSAHGDLAALIRDLPDAQLSQALMMLAGRLAK